MAKQATIIENAREQFRAVAGNAGNLVSAVRAVFEAFGASDSKAPLQKRLDAATAIAQDLQSLSEAWDAAHPLQGFPGADEKERKANRRTARGRELAVPVNNSINAMRRDFGVTLKSPGQGKTRTAHEYTEAKDTRSPREQAEASVKSTVTKHAKSSTATQLLAAFITEMRLTYGTSDVQKAFDTATVKKLIAGK